ncbi:GH25 family lysozyme [Kocuria sp. LUK]|uniref:GH25 family lysozyme n=1 Tax=Kocuria sp. LUK TaxID=2897828 RepID=UPI0027E20B78|nr:GH25 family lysozyme [Kocuria sp. LUK]
MKAPPHLALPAALTAVVLAISSLAPAAATDGAAGAEPVTLSEDRRGGLVSKVVDSGGQIVTTTEDAATGEAVLPDPATAGTRPTGDGLDGGAVMGQWAKSPEHFERLAEASARTAAELDDEPRTGERTIPDDDATGAAGTAAEEAGAAESADPAAAAEEPVAAVSSLATAASAPAGIKGTDVSNWQPTVNWSSLWNQGSRFAYVKTSEGDSITNRIFGEQYAGAGRVGMYRGGYHFAIPTRDSSGAKQADYFVNNGGGWSADGKTLPGLLDIENNPYPSLYGNQCYGFSPAEMVGWIRDFSDRYKARTGRLPAIYTNYYFWRDCTGNSTAFNDHPLHIASYGAAPQNPGGWTTWDIWQYTDAGFAERIDANVYRGTAAQLGDLARNRYHKPLGGRAPAGATTVSPSGYTVKGGIGSKYRALGGASVFGAPVMNERGGLVGGGVYQRFAKNSTFYWSAPTGAWPVNFNGAIGRKFAAHRHENGLGYPSSQERGGLVGGGAYQVFRSGANVHKILWSPGTGAYPVKENSGIGSAWKRAGFERGLGYPTTDERGGLVDGGAYQMFRSGNSIHKVLWSARSGAHPVKENSAIGAEWRAAGHERGYGYPVTGEYRYGTEVRQQFSKNFTVHYSTTTKRIWVTR